MEPDKSGGPWQTKATIPMQTSENALTVRMVTLLVIFSPFTFKSKLNAKYDNAIEDAVCCLTLLISFCDLSSL